MFLLCKVIFLGSLTCSLTTQVNMTRLFLLSTIFFFTKLEFQIRLKDVIQVSLVQVK